MAVVEEDSDNKTHHSHQISTSTTIPINNNYPRDLFNNFMSPENQRRRRNLPLPTVKPIQQPFHVEEIDEEELELSLGLSMNGRFGVDPNAKKIKRTSSIPEFMIPVSEEETGNVIPAVVNGGGLIRTCSLPVESEEEWRKRKELQSIRRMEARRKRNEKQRNLRGMRERININVVVGFEGGVVIEGGGVNSNNNLVEQGDDGLRRTTSLLRSGVGGIDLSCEKESPPQQGGSGGGSIGSYHGTGSSSGTSESEGQQQNGHDEQKSPVAVGARVVKNLRPQNKTKDNVKNLLEDMPSVSTKGEGPNGKRIEGFLYKYGKGEEVRILCVCHGSFLTPAEFVKHAGGPDVTNPLKHIVVSSNLN